CRSVHNEDGASNWHGFTQPIVTQPAISSNRHLCFSSTSAPFQLSHCAHRAAHTQLRTGEHTLASTHLIVKSSTRTRG
ncbi:hypothetical protein KUCAC02_009917, partial [Chaenocephalus aceratus]